MSIELKLYEHSGQVLAVFFICTLLLRLMYSKTSHLNDAPIDKEILNKVGYKVEDLELKVNVLTYKMQYGSWPSPHQIQKSNFRKNLRNVRLTLSNVNDRNEWIKHILLSPRRNESYTTYSKYNYPSKHQLTELFDAKKKSIYPYLRYNTLPIEHSSKSSKSSSDKSLKLNSVYRRTMNRRKRKVSKSENFEVQRRNAMLFPLFPKRRGSKSTSKIGRSSKFFTADNRAGSCKKFTKTMDECKRYLRELHDSNKNLGLVCSSSEISDGPSTKNIWPKTQQQNNGPMNSNEKLEETKPQKIVEEASVEQEINLNEKNSKELTTENCMEVSNTRHPVLKLVDKNVLPTTMNITFCTEMFPQQSVANMLVPQACERQKFIESSQEALNEVKKRLESLHNVLRTYEIQCPETGRSDNSSKIDNICQNVVDALVSVRTDVDNWNEKKRSRVSFHEDVKMNPIETEQTIYNSSEQYESDETGRSSEASVQNYPNMLNVYTNHFQYPLLEKFEPKIISSTIKFEKVPERVYYSISSESFDRREMNKIATATENFTTLPDVYSESNRMKSCAFTDQCPIPMEIDEDVVIMSPTSSRTEASKDSESDEKSTALLLQEALRFKRALLTRVELEKIYYVDENREDINNESILKHGTYSYINNSLQSKLLDIISEEQSVSSSTEKTSRTYMFFNIQPDTQLAYSSKFNNNITDLAQEKEILDQTMQKGYFDSKHKLESPSEYFSFSNIVQEENGVNSNQLYLSQHNFLQTKESKGSIPSNSQMKYFNNTSGKCDEKVVKMQFESHLNSAHTHMNEHEICYDYMHKGENSERHLLPVNNETELVDQNSVELFSENLNETLEDEENSNGNETANFLNSEPMRKCAIVSCTEDAEGNLLDLPNSDTYIEDHEMLTCSPNLILKRHLGTCSLIENTADMHSMIQNDNTIFELSPSESKENSIETNLMQESLTSSINQSNDSNIPEPPSAMVLINKSTDGEDLNLNWSDVKNNLNDNYVNEETIESLSKNTIILEKCDTIDTDSYCRQEVTCTQDTALGIGYRTPETRGEQNDLLKDGKSDLTTENSLVHLGKEDSINEADYKSYSNLISPHSSMYFTDEASSSTAKINTTFSKDVEGYIHSNLFTQIANEQELHYKNKDSQDYGNTESFPISMLNENKAITKTEKSCTNVSDSEYDRKQTILDSNDKTNNNETSAKNYVKSMDVPSCNETKKILKTGNEITKDNTSTSYTGTNNQRLLSPRSINVMTGKAQSHSLINNRESPNIDQNAFLLNVSSCQTSPRDMKENMAMKKMSTALKSRSQENYSSKFETQRKSISPRNVKGIKNDSLSTSIIHNKTESSPNSTHAKGRDLSVESRRSTERSVTLDQKRSRSQISFRTNESSKHVTPRSYESPSSTHTINYTQSAENKLKLKGHNKNLLPTPKTSSKSCIPILKSRLEAARRTDNEARPKSPMRGPLTMTMLWKDNLCAKNCNAMEDIQMEGKLESNIQCIEGRSSLNKIDNQKHIDKQDLLKTSYTVQNINENTDSNIAPQEQMVIYVNIFTKYDHNTTKIVDPNKFLEYIKNRESHEKKVFEENQSAKENKGEPAISADKEKNTMHKIVTIVSSVINDNELDNRTTSADLSSPKTKSESSTNTLSNEKFRNLCFLSVEQREVDVTAKPSVIDTSTSISDLENRLEPPKHTFNKFQICGTPKELNNEEYVSLLEILHQEPNFIHLQELQNVCKKLVSEHPKFK